MRLPQAGPEDRGEAPYEHFTYWSIAGGEKHHAYTAGPCQWFVCHPSERTKPCLHWFTKGQLPCRWCGGKKPRQTCGYLPVWRGTDWRPKLVVVYEPERQHIEKLRNLTRVLIAREAEKGAALYVRATASQEPPFNTTQEHRKHPQDIWRSLLLAWDIAELTAWVQCRSPLSDTALSLDLAPSIPPADERPDQARESAAQRSDSRDPPTIGDIEPEVRNRLKKSAGLGKPSTNGKH